MVAFHKILLFPFWSIHEFQKTTFQNTRFHNLPFQMIPALILLKVQTGKDLPFHVLPLHDVWLQFLWYCLLPVDENIRGENRIRATFSSFSSSNINLVHHIRNPQINIHKPPFTNPASKQKIHAKQTYFQVKCQRQNNTSLPHRPT